MNTFLSPIILNALVVNSSAFWANPEGPKDGQVQCNVNVDFSKADLMESDAGYLLDVEITVSFRMWDFSDDGTEGTERMNAVVAMQGAVSMSAETASANPDIPIESTLKINAISLFYSEARAYIERMTSMSSMGRFTIPTIDPVACLNTLSESDS